MKVRKSGEKAQMNTLPNDMAYAILPGPDLIFLVVAILYSSLYIIIYPNADNTIFVVTVMARPLVSPYS